MLKAAAVSGGACYSQGCYYVATAILTVALAGTLLSGWAVAAPYKEVLLASLASIKRVAVLFAVTYEPVVWAVKNTIVEGIRPLNAACTTLACRVLAVMQRTAGDITNKLRDSSLDAEDLARRLQEKARSWTTFLGQVWSFVSTKMAAAMCCGREGSLTPHEVAAVARATSAVFGADDAILTGGRHVGSKPARQASPARQRRR